MSRQYVALIPARSGSTGLPHKNLLQISSRTLIERAVDCVADNDAISEIYVSSDSEQYLSSIRSTSSKIKKIVREISASCAKSTASQVIENLLKNFPIPNETYVVYLQPTSPLRSATHVSNAIHLLEQKNARSLLSVVKVSQHPDKALKIENDCVEYNSLSGNATSNRQELPELVYPNGAIYIFQVSHFLELGDVPIAGAIPFQMTKRDSLDIDEKLDFEFAKYLLEKNDL